MFKFVADDVGGVGAKRQHGQRPCQACRKRHKRCSHMLTPCPESRQRLSSTPQPPSREPVDLDSDEAQIGAVNVPLSPEAAISSPRPGSSRARLPLDPPKAEAYLRFVGDLSPEASFLANRSRGEGDRNTSNLAGVGVWLQKPEDRSLADGHAPGISLPIPQRPGLPGLQALSPLLRQECMSVLPPAHDFQRMSDLYYAKFDPIFPVLRDEKLEQLGDMEAVALKQCICLQAALDPSLRGHLRLPHSEQPLTLPDFRSRVAAAVKQSLDLGFVRDKVVLLQICAMMALQAGDQQPSCSEISTYYVSQAVEYTQTLGLHLGWPDRAGDGGAVGGPRSRRIFWCVWALDLLSAATNGRPVLIHARDMGPRIRASVAEQTPPFGLLLRISALLDDTIAQYRPSDGKSALVPSHTEQPTFEGLVQEAGAMDVGSALLASLELFYLAVVILRSRPKGQDEPPNLRAPSSSVQSFCAASIVSIASEEFRTSITFWAGVPYAVSLAASVAYQSLRNSDIPYRRKRAYALFHGSCAVLDDLGRSFTSARAMARLATDTLHQVERAAVGKSLATRTREQDTNHDISRRDSGPERHHIPDGTCDPSTASACGEHGEIGLGEQTAPSNSASSGLRGAVPDTADPSYSTASFDANFMDAFTGDAGIFDAFEPDFDLGRIDAVFSANLDPTLPLPPEDWMEGWEA